MAHIPNVLYTILSLSSSFFLMGAIPFKLIIFFQTNSDLVYILHTQYGNTPLHLAAERGDPNSCKILIVEGKPDVNCKNNVRTLKFMYT